MKKFFILLIICLTLVSCATGNTLTKERSFSEEDASYALRNAVENTIENSASDFYNYIYSEETFVPFAYKLLELKKDSIPGMNGLLRDFKTYFSSLILDSVYRLFDFTEEKMSSLTFNNPNEFVTSSNTSISDYFISLYSKDITTIVESIVEKADFSLLKQAIEKFNTYQNLASLDGSFPYSKLNMSNFNALFTDLIARNYMETLRKSEELYRTTPSPYADNTVKKVFGNW